MAFLVDLAQAVTDELGNGSWSQSFTVSRVYRPELKRHELSGVTVQVIGAAIDIGIAEGDRSREHLHDYRVEIGVLRPLDDAHDVLAGDDLTEADDLMDLTEEIIDHFRGLALASPAATCIEATCDPAYQPEWLLENHVLGSLIALTWRTMR